MKDDTRAVSVAITHALTIAITTILLSTLLIGAGQLLTDQQNRVAREQLSEVGSDIVSHINQLDRLGATGETVTATVRPSYPSRIVGEEYELAITDDDSTFPFETDHALAVRFERFQEPIQYPLRTDRTLLESQVEGGQVPLCLLTNGTITMERACP